MTSHSTPPTSHAGQHPAAPTSAADRPVPRRAWIVVLCWLTVVFEGFDVVALGAAIPSLLDQKHGGIDPTGATYVATISLVGIGIGAMLASLSDRYGRRIPLIVCIVTFSVFTLLFPLAPSVAAMAALRFVAGLGLGGCMPIALTVVQEVAPGGRKAHSTTITMTGYHVGAVLASLIAILVGVHWEWIFYAGGIIGLVVAVVVWVGLPETGRAAHAERAGGAAPGARIGSAAEPGPTVRIWDLLRPPYLLITVSLWVAAFMGLLLVYGLNTWLPQLMRGAGYNLSDALVLLLILNAGGVAGLLVGGRIADRRGVKGTAMLWFGAAAVLLALLSIRMENQLVLDSVVFVTGAFVFCAQVIVYGFVGYLYPRRIVGSGLGFVSGVGRLGAIVGPAVTGVLVTAGIAYPLGFYLFAAAAVLGLVAVAIIPRPGTRPASTGSPAQ